MEDKEIEIIEKIIKEKMDILEWGAGGSTVYFSRLLNIFTWDAIEYDFAWDKELKLLNLKNVNIYLFEEKKLGKKDLMIAPMNEYVNFPLTLNKKYDIILIDGRKRRRCLLNARNLLKPNGIILLHDAQRKYYHCAMKDYKGKWLTDKLWQGCQ